MDTFLDTLMHLQPAMQVMAERLLHSVTDAEDAVQETVVELWEKRTGLVKVQNLEGYAMQAVKYRCLSLLRRSKTLSLDEMGEMESLSDEDAVAEAALMEERAAALDRMMDRLPEKQRQAIQLRYIDQLSHEEMQQRLQMSSTHVYATLSRAVSALKTMIKQ
ncbi:MAG: sigma-70 family RNA polymerase sigma factor [Bacteroidales bacterium]|nr:sigma-70 family RNA polymerase sigma factor [Bacteroidales bacterium]